jgi:hypothetical protein
MQFERFDFLLNHNPAKTGRLNSKLSGPDRPPASAGHTQPVASSDAF